MKPTRALWSAGRWVKLSRAVVRLSGRDAPNLLQALMTNDIHNLKYCSRVATERRGVAGMGDDADEPQQPSDQLSLYTVFLNNSGRVLVDVLLHCLRPGEIVIDCDWREAESVVLHLRRYKLRKKVKFEIDESTYVFASLSPESNLSNDVTMLPDPRCPLHAPSRILLDQSELPPLDQSQLPSLDQSDEEEYTLARYRLGIPEGPDEIAREKALPLNHNLDMMNGISFTKGCYLGQELTARTHFTGVIRRRIYPVTLSKRLPSNGPINLALYPTPPTGGPQSPDSESPAAKVGNLVCTRGTLGLAMMKVDCGDEATVLSDTIVKRMPTFWKLDS